MNVSDSFLSRRLSVLFLALLALPVSALELGQLLTPTQIAALPAQKIEVGGETLRVVVGAVGKSGIGRSTLVINAVGAVGESHHEVLVSRVSPAIVRSTVTQLRLPAVATSYFEHTGMSALRFGNFEQAVQARDQLARQLPKAAVSVPVQYAELRKR